jgi:beta-mannanase
VFRQQNVTNATYVFITTGFANRVTDGRQADLWYPGDAYVDAIGVDNYNWSNCRPGIKTPWRSMEYIADPLDRPDVDGGNR